MANANTYLDYAGLQAFKTKCDTTYIGYNAVLMPTNPFGGKKLFNTKIDNAFFNLAKRFTVTANWTNSSAGTSGSYSDSDIAKLFDGSYETQFCIKAGCVATITVTFDNSNGHEGTLLNGNYCYPTYFQGKIYLSYYYIYGAKTASTASFLKVPYSGSTSTVNVTATIFNGSYSTGSNIIEQISTSSVERCANFTITITAPSDSELDVTQMDFLPTRPSPSINPYINKFGANKIYDVLTNAGFLPRFDNTHDIGSSSLKYRYVYATTFYGDLNGTASSASKLNTDAGSATQPIYFSNGIPVATTYELNKTVPADAKFTDTTYSKLTEFEDDLGSNPTHTHSQYLEITNITNYYWANMNIATASSTTTTPTFSAINIGGGSAAIQYNSTDNSIEFVFN